MNGSEILDLKMRENDAKAETIRDYLIGLAQQVWDRGECFSGKRPFGNSGWEYEIYTALVQGEAIDGQIDETDGYFDLIDFNRDQAQAAVKAAFDALREAR